MFAKSSLIALLLHEVQQRPGYALLSLGALCFQIAGTLWLIPLAEQVLSVMRTGSMGAIALCLLSIMLGYVLKHVGEYAQQYLAGAFSLQWMKSTQANLYKTVLLSDMASLRTFQPDDLQSLMHEDLRHLQESLYFLLYRGLPAGVLLSVLVCTLFYLSWAFTLIMLGCVSGAHFLMRGIHHKLPLSSRVLQQTVSEVYQELGDGFYGRHLIRQYRWQQHQAQRFTVLQERWLALSKRVLALQALERPLMGISQVLILGGVLFISVLGVRQGLWEMERLIAFATALALAVDPGLWLAESRAIHQRAQGAWHRLQTFAATQKPAQPCVQFHALPEVQLQSVQVKKGEHTCFEALSWRLPQGVKWGLTGDSGEGKSTLLSLLAGLEPPQKGQVIWPESWKKEGPAVVLVDQEGFFFHRSVRENLLGPQVLCDAEVWAVLKVCQMDARLQALPEGLDTLMGEGGVYFSGGEKQRLALARALLMSPSCLLLDEATTELDEVNESLILQALCARDELTCVVISHQPRTLRYLEQTWHLEQGQLRQQVRST